jgi:KaiC/GvpD/RAD55 family RecA-like ATPase
MSDITYERTIKGFRYKDTITGLVFFAEDIHRDRWGKQRAKVVIAQNGRALDSDDLDFNDRATRNTLINSAVKQTDPALSPEAGKQAQQVMLNFCDGLWDEHQSLSVATIMHGDAEDSLPDMLIPGLIVKGGGHLLFAPPGAGKSWVAYMMQQALSHGLREPFDVPRPISTLLTNLERSEESVTRRYGRVNMALGLDRDAGFHVINNRGGTLADTLDAMRQSVKENGHEVVILDSLSRSGASLINDQEANATMDALNGLGVTWIAVAHSPYGDNSNTFGSRMFQAACDVEIRLDSQTVKRHLKAVRLRPVKTNDIPPATYYVGQEFHLDYGLARVWRTDVDEFPARSCEGWNKDKPCERMTWGGVDGVDGTYCARHRRERMDDD